MKKSTEKKQFSMSLLVRILLAVLVTVSVVLSVVAMMKYNQLLEEEEDLKAEIERLREEKKEWNDLVDHGNASALPISEQTMERILSFSPIGSDGAWKK